ncbi:MAG: tetratricopeptide repeat protein, partial [Candidatus Marinimicrobia bacterium]|nr:tetratricopeptide repeat protein [Candidatus Neomarinimicrobiota bacterium]
MPSEPKRKLAAIMFTDMVGYTALMQDDEPKARKLIQKHRELMKPLIEKHSGIILQYVGDGTFITFDSAIEAVNCGYEIQNEFKSDKELSLRIGVHIGDVVVEGDEVYGDGVNVASRLEPLAEAGGICVSHQVYENIKNQPGIKANLLGEKALKNVDHPIKIYCLVGKGLNEAKPFEEEQETEVVSKELATEEVKTKRVSKKLMSWAAGAAIILTFFFARGWFAGESSISEVAADENSLAVMFIENMTDPSDADRSAEMIRMLLSTDLSQAQSLRVISTQRLFDIAKQERGKNDILIDRSNATSVAKQARARWMLTGTFSKVGSRLVLVTELEDVWEGKIIHSQRVDGGDIFSLVDALSSEIRSDMGVIAASGEVDAPVKEITTSSSEAYQLYLEGLEFLNDSNFGSAVEKLNRAVEIDPNFLKALYKLARAYLWNDGRLAAREVVDKILLNKEGLDEEELLLVEALDAKIKNEYTITRDNYQKLLKMYPDEKEYHYALGDAYFHLGQEENLKALDAFEEALNLDPEFRLAYVHMFDIYLFERMYDKAIRVANRLINSNPDKASGYRYLADIYGWKGDLDNSIRNYEKAAELNKGNYEAVVLQGWAYRIQGKYDKALSNYAKLFKPDVPAIWQYRGKSISSYVYA